MILSSIHNWQALSCRLALQMMLCSRKALVCLGVECSTYVFMSNGTTRRTWLTPMGDTTRQSVLEANQFTSRPGIACLSWHQPGQLRDLPHRRSILMIVLAHMMRSTWMLEQPGSSLLYLHERFQWMLRKYLPWGIPAFWLHAIKIQLSMIAWSLNMHAA